MTNQTYIIGTKGIDEEEPETTDEKIWICNACGEQICIERGPRPTECTRARNLPIPKWGEKK